MTLRTEQNTATVRRDVRRQAVARLGLSPRRVRAIFEHGHWWIEDARTGALWSAVDCATHTGDCFDFEQVSQGEDA